MALPYINTSRRFLLSIAVEIFPGSDRPVSCKDRVNTPYIDAIWYETLRKANIAHVSIPHVMDEDLTINGVVGHLIFILDNV